MSWILGGLYCGVIWLVFAKLKLLRLSLPMAVVLASVGPSLIIALLLCAQYLHPFTPSAIVLERVDPIVPQLSRAGRVTKVPVTPNDPVKKGDVLFSVDPVPYQNTVDRASASLEQSKQNVALAKSSVDLAEATVKRAMADLSYAKNDRDRNEKLRKSGGSSQDELERALTRFQQASSAATQSEETLSQAKLGVRVAETQVTAAELALENAQYDFNQTDVTAPADGYVTNLQLREGMMVGGGTGAVMTLIRDAEAEERGVVVATLGEKNFLLVKEGQYAEVALDAYPGQILTGRVATAIGTSGAGQMAASGTLPSAITNGQPTRYAVRIKLDQADAIELPGGAQGQAAIYTDRLQVAGIPIMFLIRAKSWMAYLK